MTCGALLGPLRGATLNVYRAEDAQMKPASYTTERLDVAGVPNYIHQGRVLLGVEPRPEVKLALAPVPAFIRKVWSRAGNVPLQGGAEEVLTLKELVQDGHKLEDCCSAAKSLSCSWSGDEKSIRRLTLPAKMG